MLHDKSGGSADDLIKSFSSETDAVLAVLKGEPAEGTWRLKVADLVGQDTGTLRRWSLTIGLEAVTSAVRRDSNPMAAIPDANAQGVTDTITVNRAGALRSIAVPLNVRHTFIGDLEITLTSPNGTAVLLHNNQGGHADDIVKTYTRDNLPELGTLQGEAIQGDWTLKTADLVGQDVGTLVSWGLELVVGQSGPAMVRRESAPALAIPDQDAAGVSDTIQVDPAGVIAATRVNVAILHTFIGDLPRFPT